MTKDNLGQLYADMFGPNTGNMTEEEMKRWHARKTLAQQADFLLEKKDREHLALLGDEQKELNQ